MWAWPVAWPARCAETRAKFPLSICGPCAPGYVNHGGVALAAEWSGRGIACCVYLALLFSWLKQIAPALEGWGGRRRKEGGGGVGGEGERERERECVCVCERERERERERGGGGG